MSIINTFPTGAGGGSGDAPSLITYYTLPASRWSNTGQAYTQTISVVELAGGTNAIVDLAMSATAEEYKQGALAELKATGQDTEALEITAFGKRPEIDLPIQIILINDVVSTYVTSSLLASTWQGGKAPYMQTIAFPMISQTSNVLIDLTMDATGPQYGTARKAMLKAAGQSNGAITIVAYGVKPAIDLPIQILIMR